MPPSQNDVKKLLLLCITILQFSAVHNGFACLSNPCVHGVCLDDLNSTYFCYCIDGYTGIQCQTNWNECWSNPCQNGGTCIDGIAMFNCSCPTGFLGEFCEEDFNECESNPCQNNGTCLDGPNGYNCNCLPGYSGDHCQIDIAVCNSTNETRCYNGGSCEEGPGDSFFCKCSPGWEGNLCESEANECMSAPCQNGAVCVDLHANYLCACLFGFAGRNCEEIVQICEKNPCKNGALCLIEEGHPTCYCVPDFHGELCQYQYDECQLGPRCTNGGTCIDGIDKFTCSCPQNLTGLFCECLILESNDLDCSYIAPTTIVTTVTTMETTVPNSTEATHFLNTTIDITSTTLISDTTTEFDFATQTIFPDTTLTTTEFTTFTTKTIPNTTTTEFTTTEFTSTTTEVTVPTVKMSDVTTVTEHTLFTTMTSTTHIETSTIPITLSDFTITSKTIAPITLPTATTTVAYNTTLTITPTTKPDETTTTFTTVTDVPTTVISFLTEEPRHLTDSTTSPLPTTETTTQMITSTTEEQSKIDCTKAEMKCQNGGTCIYTERGYKCVCLFDFEGPHCQISLGIRNAAFNGESYLSHKLLNHSHIAIEFEAKTLSSNGILLYSNIESSYMTLYMEQGYLQFKFSCGYQTMLLSELKIPVNNGYKMNIKANLDFSKDLKHCDASIKVNNTLSMTGDQIAEVTNYFNPSAWLHLGGTPQDISGDNLNKGFVGCMSELKISGRRLNIFKDAEDGYEVTECSSLACLTNPCSNGGVCKALENDWFCQCKNGYLGKKCEKSVCEDNPCYFGGTCIPFSGSGYICMCPYGKHGHFCENDIKISEPHFSASIRGLSSYVAYPIPDGIFKNMEITFRFTPTTMDQISILLFIGQSGYHDYYSDHIAVSFVKGYIMLTWNLGSGPRRVFTSQPIKKGARDYLVKLGQVGRRAWLYVENIGNITGRSPGSLTQLDVIPLIYLGGHESTNFSLLPHDLPLHTGFSGCIFDVELKSGSVVLSLQNSLQATGRAVGQCGTTECFDQSCQNGGACLHHGSTFMCLCQDGWFDPLCLSRNNLCEEPYSKCSKESTCVPLISNYNCDCPFGRTGKYCEKEETLTDISFTGHRSYILLNAKEFDNARVSFSMELRVLSDTGLVFFMGKKGSSFISLYLQNNLLELRVNTIKNKVTYYNPLVIRGSKLLLKGIWYPIEFGLFGRKVFLSVDGTINTGLTNVGSIMSLSKENMYLGGLPDMSHLPSQATTNYPVPLTGCIRHFHLDTKHISLNNDNIKESRNIVDCDGTPCGGEACLHGGTCWLDSFMKPRCACVQPYYGDKCQFIPDCDEKSCQNDGKCYNKKCSCLVGYTGAFCEKEIIVKIPQFDGISYLIVKKSNKRRDLGSLEIQKLYLNFTTAKPEGLFLWSKKEDCFLGLGVENGYLKLTFSGVKSKKHYVEIPSSIQTADGLFHSVDISFNPLLIKLDSNDLEITNKNEQSPEEIHILTDGVFYIGGVPGNNLLDETFGMFHENFEGCIEAFATNNDKSITDFTHFEGSNVGVCDII